MKNFREYLTESGYANILSEAGESAGSMELVKTSVEKARKFAEKAFKTKNMDLDKEIPNFDANYKIAKKAASGGETKRVDMPVIDNPQVKQFQSRLKRGHIDFKAPFANKKDQKNPFPKGLSGNTAKEWLQNGLEIHDGDKNDDKVSVKMTSLAVKNLRPIQKQIYADISINITADNGVKDSVSFLTGKSNIFVISADNRIIDGHHRFLSALLIDPNMKVNCLAIDLPISKLLPMSLSYGDAIGNKRNA